MKMIKYRSSRSGSDSSTDCDAVLERGYERNQKYNCSYENA